MEIEDRLLQLYSTVSGIPQAELDAHTPLEFYGLNSLLAARLHKLLEPDFREIPSTLLFEHRTISEVAARLSTWEKRAAAWEYAAANLHAQGPQQIRSASSTVTDIAIIGIAGRYPQAANLDEFWENLAAGRDCITPLPFRRRSKGWPVELMWGGYLEDVEGFDSLLFNIPPREADLMDPQERIFLEIAWEALDDAGYSSRRFRERHGSRVGVFAGSMYNEYPFFGVEQSLRGEPVSSGAGLADIANRISYFFDLRGPSMTVDTLCSSSLTCLHLAVESLRRGECEIALAGGVNLSLHPNKFVEQARHKMPSSHHRCRSFGAGGDGFVPGEGVGAVLLKPLDAAREDRDRIHAIIKGTAINHGGRAGGYMVPSAVAQGELARRCLHLARTPAATIGYVEAHGTGTELGDPIEISGLEQAFAGEEPAFGRWPIGSVKSSIGHLEGAAGMAGLAKTVLQLRHKQLAPSLHAEQLNPKIDWPRSRFQVQRQAAEWQAIVGKNGKPLPRRAAISSFGAGGANAHAIIEEYVEEATSPETMPVSSPQLIVLSARDEDRLKVMAGALAAFLRKHSPGLADTGYTLLEGREHMRERLAAVAGDLDQLCVQLERFCNGCAEDVIRGRAPAGAPATNLVPLEIRRSSGVPDLVALGKWWVNGGLIDPAQLFPSGGPKIVGLPSYPFDRRPHWVPWKTDRDQPASLSSVPIFKKTWKAVDHVPSGPFPGRVLCLFHAGSEAVARKLVDEFEPGQVVLLREGAGAVAVPAYTDESSALTAVERLLADSSAFAGCIDLCDLYRDEGESGPWLSRLAILQRMLEARPGAALRLLHLTAGLQEPEGPPPSFAGARIAGLIRMLRAEHKHLDATTMDTDLAQNRAPELSRQIAEESRCAAQPEICYRSGKRLRPELSSISLPEKKLQLDPERVYVVSGGTRGLGSLVARRLAERGARRMAIMGLRPLPSRERWDDRTLPGHEVEAIQTVRDLERAGATVEIYCGPLTDRNAVESFLLRARGPGKIGGLVHCAGQMAADRAPFFRRDRAAIQSVFEPKVDGLELLVELCSPDQPSFILLFSSIAAWVPALAAGVADYAAANAFMDWFANYQARKGRFWFKSVAWPSWSGAGMPGSNPPAYSQLGLGTLEIDEGLRLLEAVLCGTLEGSLLVCPGRGAETNPSALLQVPEQTAIPEAGPPQPARNWELSIQPWLKKLFAESLGMAEAELDPELPFGELGVESILLAELLRKIELQVNRSLNPTLLLENPTLLRLSEELTNCGLAPVTSQPATTPAAQKKAKCSKPDDKQSIAIIGMACRFPGAPNLTDFWSLLREGRCAVTEVPASRWDSGSLYLPQFETGKSISKWGGFINGIEDFDPDYFHMSDEEAICLDPAIRLALEGVEDCVADAGYMARELWGRDIGVFLGARISDYWRRIGARPGKAGFGSDQNFIAARVAHHLNLTGPSFVIDSACSSSLVSVQLAMRSLLSGESELALAGGAEVLLDERPYLEFSAARALSPQGRCRVFDENADGFVPGEGCGVLLLKPLHLAMRDGDRIHAVIESVAVNNDGRTMGLTTPNPASQTAVIQRALEQSGLRAEDIAMVEAHGTGTMLGDPLELRALTEAFGKPGDRSCAVGSVKSNLGHLLSAAGIAGLLKLALSLEKGEIPPTLFCERPNPRFHFESSLFYPNTSLRPWPADRPLRAGGVSAFGLGGTNAHLIARAAGQEAHTRSPQRRNPLPPALFRRRRLWLEKAPASQKVVSRTVLDEELTASILNFEFFGNGTGAG
jgi:acyl transferase domain-containing protein/NAD(P)-dependent dehydrogenase (short-subunit alcohol dehydrogenase family)